MSGVVALTVLTQFSVVERKDLIRVSYYVCTGQNGRTVRRTLGERVPSRDSGFKSQFWRLDTFCEITEPTIRPTVWCDTTAPLSCIEPGCGD
jgi:hypothetical protein